MPADAGAASPRVSEALAHFHARQGLPADGGRSAARWRITLGTLSLPMPNFAWRRRALPLHDLHHVLTGYPCTPVGEFEMAAWEFAAGRFPHPCATAFCLPLVGLGAVIAPRRTFAAFVRGRSSSTLYARGCLGEAILNSDLARLKAALLPAGERPPTARDVFGFAALAALSLSWTAVPVLLVVVPAALLLS